MAKTRKIRNVANCLIITLPRQMADIMKWSEHDKIEFETMGSNALVIRKVENKNE